MKNKITTNKIVQIGNMNDGAKFQNPQTGRVYSIDGVAPTLTTCQGGNLEPKVLAKVAGMKIVCEERTDEGLRTFNDNAIGTIRTINSGGDKRILENNEDSSEYRIRKLTPKECWRLMGYSDKDFERAKQALNNEFYNGKDRSDSQLYKQAGNSIVVDVLYYILKELYSAMPYLFDDLKVGSYFSGIGAFESGLDKLFDDINLEVSD